MTSALTQRETIRAAKKPMEPAAAPVGLLAGWGRFPVIFAEKAKRQGLQVVCVAVRHEASAELQDLCHEFHWVGVAQMGRMIRRFRKAGVREIIMAGKIHKQVMYRPWRWLSLMPDFRTLWFWFRRRRRDNQDDTLLLSLIDEFARDGLTFGSALDYCPELLVKPGVLTRRAPTAKEQEDIAYGWQLAKEMGRLDVGQSIAVMEKAVLAVEAIEGTDQAILRAGAFCKQGGFTVVKVAKPQQDRRFDVPTIGPSTIESLHRAGGRVLAIEAQQTILIDEAETVALADRYGLTIVACTFPNS